MCGFFIAYKTCLGIYTSNINVFRYCFVCCLVRFCVCYIVVLCRCSPLIFNAFPSVLVCYPDFVFYPWIYEFEHRYTTVAFIYVLSIAVLILFLWPRNIVVGAI